MTDIHLITGAKGGVGKTMSALACVWSNVYQSSLITAIDVNWHNPDFAKILSFGKTPDVSSRDGHVWYSSGVVLERPDQPFIIPKGAIQVWDFIINACEAHKESEQVVVDTGFHPLNLLQVAQSDRNLILEHMLKLQAKITDSRKRISIYIWYVSSYSAVYDDETSFRLGDTANLADRCLASWNNDWRLLLQDQGVSNHHTLMQTPLIVPVHIINPYALYKQQAWREIMGYSEDETPIDGLLKIKNDLPRTEDIITFAEFRDYLRRTYDASAQPRYRFDSLFDAWNQADEKKQRGRPKNVMAITHNCHRAVDFPEYLLEHNPINIGSTSDLGTSIISRYESFAEDIRYYLNQLILGREI